MDPLIKSPMSGIELIMVFSQPEAKVAVRDQSVTSDFPTANPNVGIPCWAGARTESPLRSNPRSGPVMSNAMMGANKIT